MVGHLSEGFTTEGIIIMFKHQRSEYGELLKFNRKERIVDGL